MTSPNLQKALNLCLKHAQIIPASMQWRSQLLCTLDMDPETQNSASIQRKVFVKTSQIQKYGIFIPPNYNGQTSWWAKGRSGCSCWCRHGRRLSSYNKQLLPKLTLFFYNLFFLNLS